MIDIIITLFQRVVHQHSVQFIILTHLKSLKSKKNHAHQSFTSTEPRRRRRKRNWYENKNYLTLLWCMLNSNIAQVRSPFSLNFSKFLLPDGRLNVVDCKPHGCGSIPCMIMIYFMFEHLGFLINPIPVKALG